MESSVTHYRAVLAYDGSAYYGWQRLRDKPTLQAAIEEALERCLGVKVPIRGAGRTDRGAHAEGQVAGFALEQAIELSELRAALDQALPADIRLRSVATAAAEFHVRTSAIEKTYEYRIAVGPTPLSLTRVWRVRRPLEPRKMSEAIVSLIGTHDFASFATKPRFVQRSTVREMREARVETRDGLIVITFRANSFLNHMVRNIVAALAKIGEGRYSPERLGAILAAKDRAASPGSAPACGLYLMNVNYGDP